MLKFICMKIRKVLGMFSIPSLVILGITAAILVVSIVMKQSGFFASAISADGATADGAQSFITIYDGENKTTMRSGATTVRDLLARAGIQYDEYDTIEPGLDDKIDSESFSINIYRARETVVVDDTVKRHIHTSSTDPEAVVSDAGIELFDEDVVEVVPYDGLLESGMMAAYQITRAKQINFDFYGEEMVVRTQADTIGEFLAEREISVDHKDTWASLEDNVKITDGIDFAVYKQGKQTKTVEEVVKFDTKTIQDYSMDYGTRKVVKEGSDGKKMVTYEIEMRNGKEVSRKVISSIVTKKPVEQEVRVGMKVNLPAGSHEDWMSRAGISSSDYGYVNFIITHESHWNPLARNRSSGATGLCQALPGNKMASAGSDWATNPITQLRWCNGYAVGRYGSWAKAYQFWTVNHWW